MNTRPDGCGLKPWLRVGCAFAMALFALSACAIGSAQSRSGATPTPPTATAAAPAPQAVAAPQATPPETVTAGSPAAAPAAAPATEQQSPASLPPQAEQTAPSGAPASGAGSEKMLPPCVPVRRNHVKHRKLKQTAPPQSPAPIGPPAPPPADALVDAQVGEVGTSLSSILGKDVKGAKGEDLGRVVDVLADARGRVRVAIIDFGGFLGVGTRRIAVDWPLLHFDPGSHDKPLVLSVDRQKLQSAPEYNSNRPRVLMPPAATDAADAGQTQK